MKKRIFCFALLLGLMLCACAVGEMEKVEAAQYHFELAPEETQYVENQIFLEPVTVSGDFGQIIFANCEFRADVINTADAYTRVMIMPDCKVEGSLILKNSVKEGTFEDPFPKFLIFESIPVICEDCMGAVVALGDFEVKWNEETYQIEDASLFLDNSKPENGMVPYEGQEANCFVVAQWWENGEKMTLIECEYDPGM